KLPFSIRCGMLQGALRRGTAVADDHLAAEAIDGRTAGEITPKSDIVGAASERRRVIADFKPVPPAAPIDRAVPVAKHGPGTRAPAVASASYDGSELSAK